MAGRKMHQTTVRFGPDLWDDIAIEARRAGVSVAQYVRDAALMRVWYARGREGDSPYGAAVEAATAASHGDASLDDDGQVVRDARTTRGAARSRHRRRGDDTSAQEALASEPPDGD